MYDANALAMQVSESESDVVGLVARLVQCENGVAAGTSRISHDRSLGAPQSSLSHSLA